MKQGLRRSQGNPRSRGNFSRPGPRRDVNRQFRRGPRDQRDNRDQRVERFDNRRFNNFRNERRPFNNRPFRGRNQRGNFNRDNRDNRDRRPRGKGGNPEKFEKRLNDDLDNYMKRDKDIHKSKLDQELEDYKSKDAVTENENTNS